MRTFCLKPQCVGTMSLKVRVTTINPSQSNASFLHPLETSENLWFSDSFRDRVSSLRRRDFGTIFFLRILRHFLNSNSYAKTCVKHCNSTACFISWGNQIFAFEGISTLYSSSLSRLNLLKDQSCLSTSFIIYYFQT